AGDLSATATERPAALSNLGRTLDDEGSAADLAFMSISAKPRISLAPLAMGILLGCSEARVQRAGTAQIDTLPDGRIEVTNSGAPAWAPGSEWRLVQDLRLGTENTAGPEQFNRIAALLADSLGMIYVLDLLAQEIRVFDSTGVFSHTIGRKGEGPGEFTDAAW